MSGSQEIRFIDYLCLLKCKLRAFGSRVTQNDYIDIIYLIFNFSKEIRENSLLLGQECVENFINNGVTCDESLEKINDPASQENYNAQQARNAIFCVGQLTINSVIACQGNLFVYYPCGWSSICVSIAGLLLEFLSQSSRTVCPKRSEQDLKD